MHDFKSNYKSIALITYASIYMKVYICKSNLPGTPVDKDVQIPRHSMIV